MSFAILATGDELLTGDTLNTNSQKISQLLHSEGFSTAMHWVSSDNEQDIIEALTFLSERYDVILITGGLGPTSDDRTRFALAHYLNLKLIEHKEAITHLQAFAQRAKIQLNSGNRQQALFPEEAELLPNPYGTAMGCYLKAPAGKQYFLLPGPPRECMPMLNHYVLPRIQKTYLSGYALLKWRLFGVAESEVGELLDNALTSVDCQTGYRMEVPYVEFKVRCRPEQSQMIHEIIDPLVSSHIISPPEYRASSVLQQKILTCSESVSIVDKATGGLLERSLLTPATYSKLCFQEDPTASVRFYLSGLEAYWLQKEFGKAILTIQFDINGYTGEETHQIPYRSPLVLDYAAEWSSFRLLHLINQSHERMT